jgi:hypothetical protein
MNETERRRERRKVIVGLRKSIRGMEQIIREQEAILEKGAKARGSKGRKVEG